MPPHGSYRYRQLVILVAVAASFLHAPSSALSHPPPSWEHLRAIPALAKPPPPIYHDALPEDGGADPSWPVLYRDKDCICAASETVWLALECKNVEYRTVLVSKETERDAAVPRIVWHDGDGDATTDPLALLEQIEARYPRRLPRFYPDLSMCVDAARSLILRLPGIMPRDAAPEFGSRAPFLFRADGTRVRRSSHCVSLEEVEETQEEYSGGAFLCGEDVSAADLAWAPYLERYAVQLPLLFPNTEACHPRSRSYAEVAAWYAAMERVPAYACRVRGDARHWRTCLERVVPRHNAHASDDRERVAGLPPAPADFGWWLGRAPRDAEALWREYATDARPWLAETPGGEAALHLLTHREEMLAAAAAARTDLSPEDADEALREVIQILVEWKMSGAPESRDDAAHRVTENGRRMARLISERVEVPRDMGMVPALALWEVQQRA